MKLEISVLASGSSGNSVYVSSPEASLLIDAGLSGKDIEKRMKKVGVYPEELDGILITHEHNDHIKGAGVFSRRYDLPLYANEDTWNQSEKCLGKISTDNCKIFEGPFSLGNLDVEPFSISHDAADPVGYILSCQGQKIGVATDMGEFSEEHIQKLKGLDFLVLEANHDLEMLINGDYPSYLKRRIRSSHGHLSNDDTAALLPKLVDSNFPKILLAHLSRDNNIPEIAYITVKNALHNAGLKVGKDLHLDFTYRDKPTKLYQVG